MCYHGLIGYVRPSAAGTGRRGDDIAFPLCRAAGFSRHEGVVALCLPEDLSDIVVGELDVRPPCLVHGGEQSFGKQRHGTVTVRVRHRPRYLRGPGKRRTGENFVWQPWWSNKAIFSFFSSSASCHDVNPAIGLRPFRQRARFGMDNRPAFRINSSHVGPVEQSSSVLRTIHAWTSSRQEAIF